MLYIYPYLPFQRFRWYPLVNYDTFVPSPFGFQIADHKIRTYSLLAEGKILREGVKMFYATPKSANEQDCNVKTDVKLWAITQSSTI